MCIRTIQLYPAMVCPDAEAAHQAQAEWLAAMAVSVAGVQLAMGRPLDTADLAVEAELLTRGTGLR